MIDKRWLKPEYRQKSGYKRFKFLGVDITFAKPVYEQPSGEREWGWGIYLMFCGHGIAVDFNDRTVWFVHEQYDDFW